MANEIINAFDEIKTRLEAAAESGGILAGVNIIEGPISDIRGDENLPYVQYDLQRTGNLEPTELNGRAFFRFDVLLRCADAKRYGYYNTGKTRGVLWLLEQVKNAIDGWPTKDLGGSGAWYEAPAYIADNFEISKLRFLYDLRVTLGTKKFTRGSL